MCGIIAILGTEPVALNLVDALKRLEYRGYDSAGVATLEDGVLTRRRAEGKLKNLEKRLASEPLQGVSGIGHTRWATHGRPNEINAHPHATDRVAVVHNGIIENFAELRRELEGRGAQFATDTDTEVVAHLVTDEMTKGADPAAAVAAALPRLRGAFALAFLFAGENDLVIGARRGSPLAIGYGNGEMYLGSDAIALAPFTGSIAYLEDGDCVILRRSGATIRNDAGALVTRPTIRSGASAFLLDKGNHRHFMAKEIHEQPEVVGHTLAHYIDFARGRIELPEELPFDFNAIDRLLCRADRQILVRALCPAAGRNRCGVGVPLPRGAVQAGQPRAVRVAVGRDRGHAGDVALCPRAASAHRVDRQRPDLDDCARKRPRDADTRRAGNRRCLYQGVHLPAHRAGVPRHRGRPRPRHAQRRRRGEAGLSPHRDATPHGRGARAGAADRASRARPRQMPRRALSRPRHELSAGARRRAQAQGDLLHSRRGVCGGRAEARPDRADRRDHAGRGDRALRSRLREDRVEHAGGGGARRADHPHYRPEGGA